MAEHRCMHGWDGRADEGGSCGICGNIFALMGFPPSLLASAGLGWLHCWLAVQLPHTELLNPTAVQTL